MAPICKLVGYRSIQKRYGCSRCDVVISEHPTVFSKAHFAKLQRALGNNGSLNSKLNHTLTSLRSE